MKIYIALPAINESEYISETIDCIRRQNTSIDFEVFVIVNNSKPSTNDSEIYLDNQKTIEYLNGITDIPLTVIDRSSKGKEMTDSRTGVGWARKIVMDEIVHTAEFDDIIISLDSDTTFGENYFGSIVKNFNENLDAVAISVPYYHKLSENEIQNRAILRYEIYMRHYLINLLRIDSPYGFTALGSAMAFRARAYKAVRGLTPKKGGEDFYFLQKLVKYGKVMIQNYETVYPSSRFSDRVAFGTGPAIIKGSKGDWKSYPIYDYRLFDKIGETYNLFSELYNRDIETPISRHLNKDSDNNTIWKKLRENHRNAKGFIRACHIRIDGLRILQFLKSEQDKVEYNDSINLRDFLKRFYMKEMKDNGMEIDSIRFEDSLITELDMIRNILKDIEQTIRNEKRDIKI